MVKGVSMLVTRRSGTIEEAIGEVIRSEAQSEGLSVSRIILFGSRARGDADDKSDWDVLVVLPHNLNRQQRLALFVRLSRALAQRLIPCDLVIRTEDEVTRESRQIGTAVRTALKEGIVL
jgi:predicted nucleotidyltransferase